MNNCREASNVIFKGILFWECFESLMKLNKMFTSSKIMRASLEQSLLPCSQTKQFQIPFIYLVNFYNFNFYELAILIYTPTKTFENIIFGQIIMSRINLLASSSRLLPKVFKFMHQENVGKSLLNHDMKIPSRHIITYLFLQHHPRIFLPL